MTSSIGNVASGGLRCARTEVVRRLPCALEWLDNGGREPASAMTMLLIPKKPEESTAFLRFQVMKASDPRDVYERALAYLQADYFQTSERFRDKLVAVRCRTRRPQSRSYPQQGCPRRNLCRSFRHLGEMEPGAQPRESRHQ